MTNEASDILGQVQKQQKLAEKNSRRALIIQPGGLGDCILTLPLAKFLMKTHSLSTVDFLGHTDYLDIFINRTVVDTIKSIHHVPLHRLFESHRSFCPEDGDPLITALSPYQWIISFLGEAESDFQKNLIFTVNCSHCAEVTSLQLKPPQDGKTHVSIFHIQEYIKENYLEMPQDIVLHNKPLLKPQKSDFVNGGRLLEEFSLDPCREICLIAPGSGGKYKCFPSAAFIQIAELLIAENIEPVFVLGPAEIERFGSEALSQFQKTAAVVSGMDLPDIFALMLKSACFLGNDSGVTHLAAAAGISTYAIFSPTSPDLYRPLGPAVEIINLGQENFQNPSKNEINAIAGRIIKRNYSKR